MQQYCDMAVRAGGHNTEMVPEVLAMNPVLKAFSPLERSEAALEPGRLTAALARRPGYPGKNRLGNLGRDNIEHPTSNAQHPTSKSGSRFLDCWALDVGRWALKRIEFIRKPSASRFVGSDLYNVL